MNALESITPMKAIVAAWFAAIIALMSALAAAAALRHDAALVSHQQSIEEKLFEPPAATSPALVTTGRRLFLDSCAHCHGADARGDEGPDLHDTQVSDRYIANIITHGIPNEMPSFAKKLRHDDITALTVYVRSLN
jgi:cytochrome c oxidase cbb3-type subunit 3